MKQSTMAHEYHNMEGEPLLHRTVMLINDSGVSNRVIAERCGVTTQTLNNWKSGRTKRPQVPTMRFVLRAIGYELTIKKS